MVVSDDPEIIEAARRSRLGLQTCFFRKPLPGVPAMLLSDFTANSMLEVRHAIEEINGVSFRDSDTEIRTSFGVHRP